MSAKEGPTWTPGPWKAEKSYSPRGGLWLISTGKATLAFLTGTANSEGVAADANLLSAAPELYEALVEALSQLEYHRADVETRAQAFAALAKARGEK